MSGSRDTGDLDRRHVWHPFTQAQTAPAPIPIRSARGNILATEDGRQILDLISSWWVTLHGHCEPSIVRAIAAQAEQLEQVIFAGFTHEPAARLAARLAALLPGGLTRVFYSDDGSTSVEVALKLAYQYWRNRGEDRRRRLLAFDGGYHGDTFGAMSIGRRSGFYAPFEDLLFAVDFVPFPATWDGDPDVAGKEAASLTAFDAWLDRHEGEGAALIVEPLLQGAAGMRICRDSFLRALADRARSAGILVIFDEVMTGFGRTGALFAALKAGVAPDLICLSKGLTGGFLPLAATVATEHIYQAFLDSGFDKAFAHGHSFTANPLGCAAALASLDLLEAPETAARIAAIENAHRAGLALLAQCPGMTRPRQMGTIAAVTLGQGESSYGAEIGRQFAAFFLERGIFVRPLGAELYFFPPFCTTDEELRRAYGVAAEAAESLLT